MYYQRCYVNNKSNIEDIVDNEQRNFVEGFAL